MTEQLSTYLNDELYEKYAMYYTCILRSISNPAQRYVGHTADPMTLSWSRRRRSVLRSSTHSRTRGGYLRKTWRNRGKHEVRPGAWHLGFTAHVEPQIWYNAGVLSRKE